MPRKKTPPAKNRPPKPVVKKAAVQVPPISDPLEHIASRYNAYPGEAVVFSTRLRLFRYPPGEVTPADSLADDDADASSPVTGTPAYTLSVLAPRGLELRTYNPVNHPAVRSVFIQDTQAGALIQWRLAPDLSLTPPVADANHAPEIVTIEFTAQATVIHRPGYEAILPYAMQLGLDSAAVLRDSQGIALAGQSVRLMVHSQSKLMRYLPEFYAGNEFLGRLMMLFESFWRDMELQIDHSELYYQPGLAPASFLPWLGSWIGFDVDADLPEDRQRRLLAAGLGLFRQRGTRQALQDYLQIYSGATPERGGEVRIVEHRGQNLVLGPAARMGVTSALGMQNRPHTFTVYLRAPRSAILELYPQDRNHSKDEVLPFETTLKLFQRRIEALIAAQKPAHTGFELKIQIVDDISEVDALPAEHFVT